MGDDDVVGILPRILGLVKPVQQTVLVAGVRVHDRHLTAGDGGAEHMGRREGGLQSVGFIRGAVGKSIRLLLPVEGEVARAVLALGFLHRLLMLRRGEVHSPTASRQAGQQGEGAALFAGEGGVVGIFKRCLIRLKGNVQRLVLGDFIIGVSFGVRVALIVAEFLARLVLDGEFAIAGHFQGQFRRLMLHAGFDDNIARDIGDGHRVGAVLLLNGIR